MHEALGEGERGRGSVGAGLAGRQPGRRVVAAVREEGHGGLAREGDRRVKAGAVARHGDVAARERELGAHAGGAAPAAVHGAAALALEHGAAGGGEEEAGLVPGGGRERAVLRCALERERRGLREDALRTALRHRHDRAAAVVGEHDRLVLGAGGHEAGLEHGREAHLGAHRRRLLEHGGGELLGHHGEDLGLDLVRRHGAVGDLVEVGEQVADLLDELLARGVAVEHGRHLVAGEATALHARVVDAAGGAVDAAGADLNRLIAARLGRAVAGVARVVRQAGGAEERRVSGALVQDLDGEAKGQEDPADEHGDEADLHVPPRARLALAAERLVDVLALGVAARRGVDPRVAVGVAQLLHDVDLALRELLGGRDEPDGVLEGGRQLPLLGPPGCTRRVRSHRRRVRRRAQADEQDRVDDVDAVAAEDQEEAERLEGGIVPTAVLDGGGEQGEPGRDRADADRPSLPGVGDDVERQNQVLEGENHQGDAAGGEEGAGLLELMAQLVVHPVVEQVLERQEEAQAGVDVVRPPVVLHLAVDLEVLRAVGLARGREGHRGAAQHGLVLDAVLDLLLLAVPGGDVEAVAGAGLSRSLHGHLVGSALVLVEAALGVARALALVRPEGDAEGLAQGLLLEGRQEAARAVELRHRGDGETHVAGEHVRAGDAGAREGVLREPEGEAQEHVGAGDVQHEQAHEPPRRGRSVQTETTRAVERGQDGEGHRGDVVERVLASLGQGGEGLDVRLVLARLGAGHADARVEPGPAILLVEGVVRTVVREQTTSDARGGRSRGGGITGSAQLHRGDC
mmetsp:Transcript_28322/g.74945  ORF Transcript_28322/g.74945 Transcript_28322/m.74945 type:complete len:801 (+) Transcript_28322:500-2902(+)